MDHLAFPPPNLNEHRLNYSLPRACYVVQQDFELVLEFDKNKLCLDKASFGKRPVSVTFFFLFVIAASSHMCVFYYKKFI